MEAQIAVRQWILAMAARYNDGHHWPHPASRRSFPPPLLATDLPDERRFTLPNGATVQIPKTAIDGLIEMLEAVAEGENATVVRTPREVSTQKAATVLNMSLPAVVKLIDDGVLRSRKVGSHRRITFADLLAYRDDMVARRRAVLDQMSRDAEELGLYD